MSEHTQLTEEWAVGYARTYWQHGNEPESQAALHILANALAARTSTATADTGLRERVGAWIDDQRQLLPDHRTPVAHGKAELLRDLRHFLDATAAPTTDTGACECDHPGIEHGSLSYVGICPGCHKCKFIGHGPLCVDCYTGARDE